MRTLGTREAFMAFPVEIVRTYTLGLRGEVDADG
jgi:hypothetical protein